jgi:hypothetical protein
VLFLHAGSLQRIQANHHPNIGRLLQPRDFSRLSDTLAAGYRVGIDNDGYQGVDFPRFDRMLANIRAAIAGEPTDWCEQPPPANLLWVLVPVVPRDAKATRELFDALHESMGDLPVAYAVQDGAADHGIPFDAPNLRALFLAGSNAYKESREMTEIADAAKARGLWLHGAPCNGERRARLFASLGCDSFDGTGASKFPALIPRYLRWASELGTTEALS